MKTLYLTLVFLCAATGAMSEQVQTSLGPVHVEKMAANLDSPWAIGILPGGAFLVTERGGTLIYVDQGRRRSVSGVPKVATTGQGGLLDVTIARDFAQSREVFLTFAKPQKGGAGTALAVARLSRNGGRLTDTRILFEARPGGTGGRHFGSRVVERADGTLFVTVGERGDRPAAQDLSNHLGTVVRIGRDGAVPPDNPFVGRDDARPEIWSYGHRNPQGAALGCTGAVMGVGTWRARRGRGQPRAAGANYGWPKISYGTHYSGEKIGEGTAKPGMEQPAHYWDPSIAPSGLLVYSGKLWPEWKGDIFVGSLKFDYIARLAGNPLREVEQIKGPETERVRDIVEGPDGAIWFLSVGQGAVYRMVPLK